MPKQPVDEGMIIDYLLGASTEAETEHLDEMSLTDDDFAQRLHAVENDLVDAYVRGELQGNAAARFDSHYLASPGRRDKVAFAERLLGFTDKAFAARAETMDEATPASVAARKTIARESSRFRLFARPHLSLQRGLAAAAVVVFFAAGYLTFENLRLRDQIAREQAERAALGQREQELRSQLADQRSSNAETENELSRKREQLARLEQQPADRQRGKTEPEQRDLRVVAFNLSPQTRGIGQIATLSLPPGTDFVALALELEADDFRAYQAALRHPTTGQIVWRSGKLKASDKSKALRVRLRGSLLNPQNYILELSGFRPSGAIESVSSYSFRVARQ
jgi:anti-sigma factor RsiW